MDEVDNIIITTLGELGCDLEDISSLEEFTIPIVVEGTVRCLTAIIPEFQSPMVLPSQMSQQFRMCQELADACRSLNYRGDIGYQTFLYSNVHDWRRVFVFLIETLPKGSNAAVGESGATEDTIRMRKFVSELIASSIKPDPLSSKYVSLGLDMSIRHKRHFGRHCTAKLAAPSLFPYSQVYCQKYMPIISSQQTSWTKSVGWNPWLSSVMEMATHGKAMLFEFEQLEKQKAGQHGSKFMEKKKEMLSQRIANGMRAGIKAAQDSQNSINTTSSLEDILSSFKVGQSGQNGSSAFQSTEKFLFAGTDPVIDELLRGSGDGTRISDSSEIEKSIEREDPQKRREREREQLTEELEKMSQETTRFELECSRLKNNLEPIKERIQNQLLQNKEAQEQYKLKKRVLDMYGQGGPEAEENAKRLENHVEETLSRIAALAEKWEQHRLKLFEDIRTLKIKLDTQRDEQQVVVEKLQNLRDKIKEAATENKLKESMIVQLREEYDKMNKDIQRSSYTKRIMEILQNIRKQSRDIDQVLTETHSLQKDINQLEGKVGRIFSLADERIFKEAKKDDAHRQAYKSVVALHRLFGQIISTVEEIGSIERNIKDLEDQIDNENSKKMTDNLDSIRNDFNNLKLENEELKSKLGLT